MRLSEDPSFRGFLTRTRQAALTEDDVVRLNAKAIPSLTHPASEDSTVIVKLNAIRHPINRIRIENFARLRSQRIYVFPAIHSRTKSTGQVNLRLQAHDLLLQPDHSAQIPFPGLLLYTRDMPTVMLTNACTPLGQVNGATGTAVGVVLDPAGKFLSSLWQRNVREISCNNPISWIVLEPEATDELSQQKPPSLDSEQPFWCPSNDQTLCPSSTMQLDAENFSLIDSNKLFGWAWTGMNRKIGEIGRRGSEQRRE